MSRPNTLSGVALVLATTGLGTMILGGCAQEPKPAGSPIERVWESPPPPVAPAPEPEAAVVAPEADQQAPEGPAGSGAATPQPVPAPADAAVAIVNGESISEGKLADMLIESHGLAMLEQLILLTAARQKAASLGVTVAPEEIKAAEDEALRRIAAPVGDPQAMPLDRPAAEKLLDDFLRLKGLSRTEWDCRMEQRAWLSAIARTEVARMEITEQMLRDEYGLAYGEKVQIRHIQCSRPEAINHAAAMLKTRPFEEVALQISENSITREQGGLMPPFTRHDGAVPPLIREKAFSIETGETTPPMREGTWYHIIRLERKFPASEVGFENVEPETLRKRLTDRLIGQRTDELDRESFQSARIQIRNRELERQFRRKHAERNQ